MTCGRLAEPRFARRSKDVAVIVAVRVCWTGSSTVMTIVLVVVPILVVGWPVILVIVLVMVSVTKTVEAPGIPMSRDAGLLRSVARAKFQGA